MRYCWIADVARFTALPISLPFAAIGVFTFALHLPTLRAPLETALNLNLHAISILNMIIIFLYPSREITRTDKETRYFYSWHLFPYPKIFPSIVLLYAWNFWITGSYLNWRFLREQDVDFFQALNLPKRKCGCTLCWTIWPFHIKLPFVVDHCLTITRFREFLPWFFHRKSHSFAQQTGRGWKESTGGFRPVFRCFIYYCENHSKIACIV